MKTISVINSKQKVVSRIEKYLKKRKYKKIHVNHTTGEITAERKISIFQKKDVIKLNVYELAQNTTKIEITLNPDQVHLTGINEAKELRLRNKILFSI